MSADSGVDDLDGVFQFGRFTSRHLGYGTEEIAQMLHALGSDSLEELIGKTIPEEIRMRRPLNLPGALSEEEALEELRGIASQNENRPTYIGMGYHGTNLPSVIRRNILENPGWYTGPDGSPSEFSDHGLRSDRYGDCECLHAG
jgi:glycine dehydrogenase